MKEVKRLRYLLIAAVVGLMSLLTAQAQSVLEQAMQKKVSKIFSKREFQRLQRYRPIPPFDESPFYGLLDSPIASKKEKLSLLNKILTNSLLGPTIELTPKLNLSLDGLIYLIPDYNKTDGVWLGYEAMLEYKIGLGRKLILRSSNNYTLKSHKYYHEHKLYYYFNPERDGLVLISAGQTSRETLAETKGEIFSMKHINPIGANSSLRQYSKTFVSLRSTISPLPKLNATLSLLYEDRKPSIVPTLERGKVILSELNLIYDFALTAPTPADYPRATQLPYGYGSVALGLNIRKAFKPSTLGLDKSEDFYHYNMIEGSIRSAWADNIFLHKLAVFGGGFIGERRLSPLDTRHFRSLSIVTPSTFDNSWATLSNDYRLDKQWAGCYWNGTSQKLLLGRTFLGARGLGFDESLHLKVLSDLDKRYYAEFGYSFGWDRFFRMGLFVGTDFTSSRANWQFAINVPITLLMSQWGERY